MPCLSSVYILGDVFWAAQELFASLVNSLAHSYGDVIQVGLLELAMQTPSCRAIISSNEGHGSGELHSFYCFQTMKFEECSVGHCTCQALTLMVPPRMEYIPEAMALPT